MNKLKPHILILGGAGFIGAHLVRNLKKNNFEISIFDSMENYEKIPLEQYRKIFFYRTHNLIQNVPIFAGNILSEEKLRSCIRFTQPTHIIHLASCPLPVIAQANPEISKLQMVDGLQNMLKIIHQEVPLLQRFLFISSSMVYGDFLSELPITEEHLLDPKNNYGKWKLLGEKITEHYCKNNSIPYTILRLSAVYGPGDSNARIVQNYIRNCIEQKPLYLQGISTKLDFTHVYDVVDGIEKATFSKQAINQIYNLTRGEARYLSEFILLLKKYFPKLRVTTQERNTITPVRGALSISKAKRDFLFQPMIDLEDDLPKIIHFEQELYPEEIACSILPL